MSNEKIIGAKPESRHYSRVEIECTQCGVLESQRNISSSARWLLVLKARIHAKHHNHDVDVKTYEYMH